MPLPTSASDVVAKLGLLGSLALHAEVQQQRHDAEGDNCATTSDKQEHHQADCALLASLDHAALLSIETGLAEAFTITADAAEVAIVIALPNLHARVADVVNCWNAKLIARRRGKRVLLVRRYIGLSVLGLAHEQTHILRWGRSCLLLHSHLCFLESKQFDFAIDSGEARATHAL